MFTCKRCNYQSKTKCNMYKHLTRKTECLCEFDTIERDVLISELNINNHDRSARTYVCKRCNASYKHQPTLSYHMKSCEGNKHFTNTNNSQNNIVNNITIKHNYGSERIDHIEKELVFLYNSLYNRDLMPLIESIYCDPEHPENHTIRFKNVKQKLMEKYVDKKWIVASQDDIFQDVINKGFNVLKLHLRKNENDVRQRLIDDDDDDDEFAYIVHWVRSCSDDDKQIIKLKNYLVILFRNNKDLLLSRC